MSKTMQWTAEQWEAIERKGGNLLVAAAAGSGKTAVLVERIIQRILDPKDPYDLDQLLVVTFTEAAAAEMRIRIGKAIEKRLQEEPTNEHLQRQLALLNKASISTLHSFCFSIVRRYFYRLGLDPRLTVISENESILLQQEALERVLEREYANGREDFYQLVEFFGNRKEEGLGEQMLRLSRFLSTLPFPEKWLEQALEPYKKNGEMELENMPWYPEFINLVKTKIKIACWYHGKGIELASLPGGPAEYLPNLEAELTTMRDFLSNCHESSSWEDLCLQGQRTDDFPRLKAIKKGMVDEELKDQITAYRNKSKDIIRKELLPYFQRSRAEIIGEIEALEPILQELVALVAAFQKEYKAAKKSKGQVDFNDLEHYCLELLLGEEGPSDLALALRKQYREVMIDEYQDTNDLQEAILQLVSRQGEEQPNLFMVGDVKQSIYRFRQANPNLFLQKYQDFPTGIQEGPNSKILLSANFRSREEVVNGVNFFFRQLMTSQGGELDYDEEEELVYRAYYPQEEKGMELAAGPVEVHLLSHEPSPGTTDEDEENPSQGDLTAFEKEAHLMAQRIQELVGASHGPPVFVWDPGQNDYRPARYQDIVILLRSPQSRGNSLLEIFHQYEIPVFAELGTGYFQATEISIMLSLLQIIDNPRQDIPLAGVLRSPMVGLTTEELAQIKEGGGSGDFYHSLCTFAKTQGETPLGQSLNGFLEQLSRWRTLARRGSPLSRLIWQIYQETGFLDYSSVMPGGKQRKANLHALYHRAREFDGFARHGLFRFLRFITQLQERDEDLGVAGAYGESDNVVRVMSIHKSKGLEFPIVFVADLGRQFNLMDLNHDLLLHPELGFGPLYFDPVHRIKYPSGGFHWALRSALRRANLAEEMRVLYVAFTRAREKLILVGSQRKLTEARERWQQFAQEPGKQLPLPVLVEASGFMDWLGPALMRGAASDLAGNNPLFSFRYWGLTAEDDLSIQPHGREDRDFPWEKIKNLTPLAKAKPQSQMDLTRQLTWTYPHLKAATKSAKLSATEVKKRLLAEDPEARHLLFRPAIIARPAFVQEKQGLTGAELGTATHLVMQHLDFQKVNSQKEILEQIEKMVEEEFLTAEQAQGVGWQQFLEFFQSPLGQRLRRALPAQVKREIPFTLALPAEEVYREMEDSEGETIIIQGIIDCLLLEEEKISLIDYKTDRFRREDLAKMAASYQYQLELYAKAVGEIYHYPVVAKYLHFFHLQETVELE